MAQVKVVLSRHKIVHAANSMRKTVCGRRMYEDYYYLESIKPVSCKKCTQIIKGKK
ncbi:hypothetical protein SEA_CAMERICO_66 [Gordonia phage Camerico]|nr:hypothetical protein SEA_CAMERICO_66 [Gordonia phage Camerico]